MKAYRRGAMTLAVAVLVMTTSHAVVGQRAEARPQTLRDVLDRAGHYVQEYGKSLASVLAEEHYSQRLVWRGTDRALETRMLRSEIAFVTLVDSSQWLAFRNVMSVDGAPVKESEGRLARLFDDAPASYLSQVRRIASESARYNLGPITREVNVPTTALYFLQSTHQRRCKFEKDGEEPVGNELAWKIRYEERDDGIAYIRRVDGRRLFAEGHLWIVPADGRVVRTELVVKDFVRGARGSRATIRIEWRYDQGLDLWVPSQLREHYEGGWEPAMTPSGVRRYDIDGVAEYSNYRRFRVDVKIR